MFSYIKIYSYFIALAIIVTMSACSKKNDVSPYVTLKKDAIEVVDVLGNPVRLQQPAQRIVVLFEASLDDLYMLGAGQSVIGIPAKIYHAADLYQAYSILDSRIKAKSIATPSLWESSTNIESLVALKPDLVIVSSGQFDLIQLLHKMEIPVYAVQSENLMQTRKELLDLGILTNKLARAQDLLHFIDIEIQSLKMIKANMQPKTVYYAWSGGRIFSTSGQNSMISLMMELAGAKNIVTTAIDQPNVNPEKLLEWNPDAILLWNSSPDLIYQQRELQQLNAVKSRQVYNLTPSFLYNPHTPKILLGANQLHHWLYSEHISQTQTAPTSDKLRILSMFYGAKHAQQLIDTLEKS